MHNSAALLTAGLSGKWIPLAIVAAACVLAAELVCAVVLLIRISHARKSGRADHPVSAKLWMPLVSVSLLPAEIALLVLVIAVLATAVLIVGILIFARVNGYDFMSTARLPDRKPEPNEPEQPVLADPEQALDDAIATFAQDVTDPQDEPEEKAVAAEMQSPAETEESAAPAERIVERYVTETVREREIVRETGSDELYRAINTLSDLLADERRRAPDPDEEEPEEEPSDDATDLEEGEEAFDEPEENESENTGAFTGNERVIGFDEESGCYIVASYRKSFEARLIQASPFIKKCYSQLKNALLAYKGTKSRISWSCDSYTNERTAIAKINVKSHILELYLALDPASLDGSVYHGTDVSDKKKYEDTPFRYKLRSTRKLQWALELVERVCVEQGLSPIDAEQVDYEQLYPFDSTENLVERKLIKETRRLEQKSTTFELDEDHTTQLPQEDPSVIPANANFSWEFDEEAPSSPAEEQQDTATPAEEPLPEEPVVDPVDTPAVEPAVSESVHIMQRRVTEHYYANGERDRVEEVITTDAPITDIGELPPSIDAEFEETPAQEPSEEEIPEQEPEKIPVPQVEEIPTESPAPQEEPEQPFNAEEDESEDSVPAFGASYVDTRYADVRHSNPYRDRSSFSRAYPYRDPVDVDECLEERTQPQEPVAEQPGPVYETRKPVYEEPVQKPQPLPSTVRQKANIHAATVDVRVLEQNFAYGSTVNLRALQEKGLILRSATTLKIVASADMSKAMTVEANQFSLRAIRAITEAGGETIWIQ